VKQIHYDVMPCEDGALKRCKIAVAWSYRDNTTERFNDKKEWAEEEP
jgi:hypothetical protein